ncbi:hypothetical protein [Nonomuraea cavernae]|uniref:Uncharacterized protein n=1 Tax=Nonomuraea cavernae TaxID=2045107 RepID=A0A917YNM7_9ACTN|nr:hypothetical protein [Nonomuraea cavernae]MCA2183514.1 hypothetical protein [Nonomuraea cavernae]GGO60523.1 hypothetical protein GCM10012289_00590 [Nonomuraea cavernae]
MAVLAAMAFGVEGAAASGAARPEGEAPAAAPATVATPAETGETRADEPECVRVRGAAACVGDDESSRPGVSIEDTRNDRLHPAVEYYLNGYLGTKYVIHNLAREGEIRGSREIGKTITFRAALYKGDRRVKVSRWKTVRDVTKYPVKRDTRVTPAGARARSAICVSTRGAASTCFAEKNTFVFACDTGADEHQARAEYFVGGDPTARYEIHQLAGVNTCGKAEHGDLAISMYRASVFDDDHQVATRLYKYN